MSIPHNSQSPCCLPGGTPWLFPEQSQESSSTGSRGWMPQPGAGDSVLGNGLENGGEDSFLLRWLAPQGKQRRPV